MTISAKIDRCRLCGGKELVDILELGAQPPANSLRKEKEELLEKIQTHVKNFAVVYDNYYQDPDKRNYIVLNDKIESTGWKPMYDLDMGIKELIMAYQMIVPKMGAEFRNGFPLGYANNS